jgi:hypothetical protein
MAIIPLTRALRRMMQTAKQYRQRKEQLAKEKGGVFIPDTSASQQSYRGSNVEEPFEFRLEEEISLRAEKDKLRELIKDDPAQAGCTFQPTIHTKDGDRIVRRRGSFMDRMQEDVRRRERKDAYRAKLFGLPDPKDRRRAAGLVIDAPTGKSARASAAGNKKKKKKKPHFKAADRPQTATSAPGAVAGPKKSTQRPVSAR